MLNRFKIGHVSDASHATGCTVIIPPEKNITSASAKGAATGTREYALLLPDKKVQSVQAILLTGGSAFGLRTADGVMQWLEENGRGYPTPFARVPIVPAAVIYDLNLGTADTRPGPREGYNAAAQAVFLNRATGNVGVGTGATVGKWAGLNHAMKGGWGLAETAYNGVQVACGIAVNAVGDVYDFSNTLLAGAHANGRFLADTSADRYKNLDIRFGNTVIGAVMTNARMDKQQAHYLAERAHFGIARRIFPSHTSYDGDVLFLSSSVDADTSLSIDVLAMMIIETVENAIINALRTARPLHGIPAVNHPSV